MKKSVMLLKMFSATLAVLLVAGIIWHFAVPPDKEAVSNTAVQTAKGEAAAGGGETEEMEEIEEIPVPEEEVTQMDIEKLVMKLEVFEGKEADVLETLEFYRSLPDGLTEEELCRIAKSRVLQCYEENVVLAMEAKTLLIGGLGVSIPTGYAQEDAMEAYGEYLKDELGIGGLDSIEDVGGYLAGEIAGGIIGEVGAEGVQNAVRYGIDGALEAYEADGTLGAALSGAVDSVVEGVVSDIQEYPYELARNALNEVTGGLFGVAEGLAASDSPEDFLHNLADEKSGGLFSSIAGVVTYEGSPTALFQSMSKSASASAANLSGFLEKDTVNSGDIANMMYQYSQYGEVLHDLNGYNWGENYSDMQEVYAKFVQNEVMIDFLGGIVETTGEQASDGETPGGGITAGGMDLGKASAGRVSGGETAAAEKSAGETAVAGKAAGGDKMQLAAQPEEMPEGSLEEQYRWLETRIAKLEADIPAHQEELEGLMESKFTVLYRYAGQLEEVKEKYKDLRNFNVKNFNPLYDVGGRKIIEDNKKINNAIGELSKYTPWGITLGLFSSMAMEDGNADYAAMVSANDAFGTGMQRITVDTKAEIEKFNAQITFYEGLTKNKVAGHKVSILASNDWLQDACENQYLLEYVLNGEEINLDSYAEEVCKKLYIMGMEVSLIRDYYATLLTDCNSKDNSLRKLQNQYAEIMAAADPEGTGRIASMVTAEELGRYAIPLIDAGKTAENNISAVWATSPLVSYTQDYTEYGKVYWYYKKSGVMKWEGAGILVYYAGGAPVYVAVGEKSCYFCQGIWLNDDGSVENIEELYNAAKQFGGRKNVTDLRAAGAL